MVGRLLLWSTLAGCLGLLLLTVHGLVMAGRTRWLERQARRRRQPLVLQVLRRREQGALVHLTLARPDGKRLPAFGGGDHVVLMAELASGLARRAYSLAAWERRPRRWELVVKREVQGRVSGWIHDTLHVGAQVRCLPPKAAFRLDGSAGERVLVAAGVGITPMRAMLHEQAAARLRRPQPLTLLWAVRHASDLHLFAEEFDALAARHPWLRWVPVVSAPDADWPGESGRLSGQRLLGLRQGGPLAGVWICAAPEMAQALKAQLVACGVAPERIHSEAFGVAAAQGSSSGTVRLWPHGRCLDAQGYPTLLHLLEDAGVAIDSECRAGTCGRCRIRVREGSLDSVAPPACRLRAGEQLACCSRCTSDVTIEVL
jgi:ferredoxin-NADP reductase